MGATGVARYVLRLYAALAASGAELVPFAFGRGRHPVPSETRRGALPYQVSRTAWRVTSKPRVESLVGDIDLVHVTDLAPPPTRAPIILTIHDLAALEHPTLHSRRQRAAQRNQVAAARRATLVLTDSGVTARTLKAHGVDTPTVTIPLAAFDALPQKGRVIEDPYLLAVGELAARKDLPTLIEGFRTADLPPDVRLVLAGPDGYGVEQIRPLIGGAVVGLGWVTDPQLAALYRDALGLCSSSVAEGFNLPLVEAMIAGVPVAASALPVTEEVTDGAVMTVPVGDIAAWASAIERLVKDDVLRVELARRGRERAHHFSWEKTGEMVLAAYRTVIG